MCEVIVALDTPSAPGALELVRRLGPASGFYKVGLELFTAEGPSVVRALKARDKRVFLDLKLHDIPSTVAGAVRAARALSVDLLTVHASGGTAMLEAARDASEGEVRLVAATVLTSFDARELGGAWGKPVTSVSDEVSRLAAVATTSGLDGIVVAAPDAERIRSEVGAEFLLVVPGIRPSGASHDDQRRVGTPAAAVKAGADYLVLGRAVTRSADPAAALAGVLAELASAGAHRA